MPAVKSFKTPKESLGDLNAESTATLIAAAADITLILDEGGVILDLAFGSEELSLEVDSRWLGQPWVDTVVAESRPKVETLLREAVSHETPKWRQINHLSPRGMDVPIRYCAMQVGHQGRVMAIGHNLQAVAALQQQLVDAQQTLERDYWRLRQVETRYRLLFQMASEAVLIVDASTQKVLEANPTADQLLGDSGRGIVGRLFPEGFDVKGTQAVEALLAGVRAAGRANDVRARLLDDKGEFFVSAFLLRQGHTSLFLVRISPMQADASAAAMPATKAKLIKVIESAPDGVVLTGPEGQILTANPAFLDLAQLATEEQARGESLDHWLGRPGVDLNVLLANLRQHGAVRLFATSLRGEYGATAEVEISAATIRNGDRPCFGFIIRNIGRRIAAPAPTGQELPRSVEQLTELVGRVPLKELVRESTDMIERLCIEAALELTGDNRASAAELLGLSRQSLYVKLRRYGLADLDGDNSD